MRYGNEARVGTGMGMRDSRVIFRVLCCCACICMHAWRRVGGRGMCMRDDCFVQARRGRNIVLTFVRRDGWGLDWFRGVFFVMGRRIEGGMYVRCGSTYG